MRDYHRRGHRVPVVKHYLQVRLDLGLAELEAFDAMGVLRHLSLEDRLSVRVNSLKDDNVALAEDAGVVNGHDFLSLILFI